MDGQTAGSAVRRSRAPRTIHDPRQLRRELVGLLAEGAVRVVERSRSGPDIPDRREHLSKLSESSPDELELPGHAGLSVSARDKRRRGGHA